MTSTQSAHRLGVVGDRLPFFSLKIKSDACLSKEGMEIANYFATFNYIEGKRRKTPANDTAGDVCVWEAVCLLI